MNFGGSQIIERTFAAVIRVKNHDLRAKLRSSGVF